MRSHKIYKSGLVILGCALVCFVCELPVSAQNIKYMITDLGTFGGGRSVAFSINNWGEVVGYSENSLNESHAFLYQAGVLFDLGTLGGKESYAYHMSDSGLIVGRSQNEKGFYRPFITTIAGPQFDLSSLDPLLDGLFSTLSGANRRGQMVGYTATATGYNHGLRHRSFLYSNSQVIDLGTMGGEESVATAINDAGQIAGYISKESHAAYAARRAYVYSQGVLIDLGSFGGQMTTPTGINSSGQVVGYAQTPDGEPHAFIYSGKTLQDLGTLPGGSQSLAFGTNDAGLVVGAADTSARVLHAFIYSKGVMQDLNDLIPVSSGWVLTEARSINESGQIVGNGIVNGQERGFLLTPVGFPGASARAAQRNGQR
jgi:probable HAF family extracellular repeat protein